MNQISRTSISSADPVKEFVKLFGITARYKHRYELFRDFITVSAIALHNGISFDQSREDEYLRIIKGYSREDVVNITRMMALLVQALDVEPADVLGQLYMSLEFGSSHHGQFFTPDGISRLMAGIQVADIDELLRTRDFIKLSEPACGAGGMILAVINTLVGKGIDPAKRIFVEAIDIDRTAALMCYIQLSLWNVPAEVIVGDCLRLDYREHWFTPAYHLNGWAARLR
jgi:hypothetical protein